MYWHFQNSECTVIEELDDCSSVASSKVKNLVFGVYIMCIHTCLHWQESWSGGSCSSEAEINRLKADISALTKEKKSLEVELGSRSDTEQVSSQVISW